MADQVREWWPFVSHHLGQTLLGCVWLSMGLGIFMFFFHYYDYHQKGFTLGQRKYILIY
jgi:hypothetical protein